MATRTKACSECGKNFSYTVGRGHDRKYCLAGCEDAARERTRQERMRAKGTCTVPECTSLIARKGLYCEKHYYRIRRTGKVDRPILGRYTTGAGYIKLLDPTHPLSDSKGHVAEHRHVAYVEHKGECPSCFWCGEYLEWPIAVIDHLDEQKDNNEPSNLVVSCNDCNRARGSLLPFLRRMRSEAFPVFVARMEAYRKG